MPHSDLGWEWLHKQGVKSVVTFRPEHDVNYGQFGLQVMRLPMEEDPPANNRRRNFYALSRTRRTSRYTSIARLESGTPD